MEPSARGPGSGSSQLWMLLRLPVREIESCGFKMRESECFPEAIPLSLILFVPLR